jgi:putative ABC transport system substrate-binding protein
MKNILKLIAIVVTLVDCAAMAGAQQPTKVPRIGFIDAVGDPSSPSLFVQGFRQGLRELAYTEGKNIVIEYRYGQGKLDRLPSLVNELVQLKPDVSM